MEDAIAVTCPPIIARDQFDRVAAMRATRNPRRMAPHVAAGTTLLTGVARCGMPGCSSGMTIRRVSDHEVVISGPVSSLENGVSVGLPVKEGAMSIFDREWCRLQASN